MEGKIKATCVTLLEEGEMAVAAAVAHLPQLTRDGCLLNVWPIV